MTPSDLVGLHVLVVDDNATNREIMSHYTRAWNMRCTCAPSGEEALWLLRTAAVDDPYELVILLICRCRTWTASMLAAHIKKDKGIPPARLVLLTSLGNDLDAPELQATDIAACVMKARPAHAAARIA